MLLLVNIADVYDRFIIIASTANDIDMIKPNNIFLLLSTITLTSFLFSFLWNLFF